MLNIHIATIIMGSITSIASTSNSSSASTPETNPLIGKCLFSCPAIINLTPFCAGPISGCGELKVFDFSCALLSYNCQNANNREYLMKNK